MVGRVRGHPVPGPASLPANVLQCAFLRSLAASGVEFEDDGVFFDREHGHSLFADRQSHALEVEHLTDHWLRKELQMTMH